MVLFCPKWESIMTTNIVLLIVAAMLTFAAVRVYFGYMKIANELYIRLVEDMNSDEIDRGKGKSPYTIKREYSSYSSRDYYYIQKNGSTVNTKSFSTAKEAQTSMNELEQLEGFRKTKVV